jgi:putative pre-16S rRNA nuclease
MIEGRILAIDYGKKRIGLALSDPLLTFAYPFKTISNSVNLWKELTDLIKEKEVVKIILGYPLKVDGGFSTITDEVIKFKRSLEQRVNCEILFRDERYTSLIAKERILQSVTKKSKRREKGLIDQNSAAILLQDYLSELQ